jgi:signal transduction histidine kinase
MKAMTMAGRGRVLAGVCCLVAFLLVSAVPSVWAENTGDGQGEEEPLAGFDKLLKDAMDKFMAEVDKIMADDSLTDEEKQAKVLELARTTTFASDTNAPENQDIFFQIFLQDGTLLADPAKPDDEGKNFSEYRDQDDFFVFQEMLKIVGGGYLGYLWPRPDGEAQVSKKSYIQVLEPWGWIICVGKYLQTVEAFEPDVEPASILVDDPPEEIPPASGD